MVSEMNREDEKLVRVLEQFARVSKADGLAQFKVKHSTFFPEKFWEDKVRQVPPGVSMTAQPQLPSIDLWKGWQTVLLDAWRRGFPLSEVTRLLVAPVIREVDVLSSLSEHPYQRALLVVAGEPWRARFCAKCGAPFAALKANSKFCSAECFAGSRLNTKRKWWAEQGSERRRKRSKKQAHASKTQKQSQRSRRKSA
jgi:hypothetical protein